MAKTTPVDDENTKTKSMNADTTEHVDHALNALVGVKKTYRQELSVWSGTTKVGYLNHLIRPFPLLAYPAIALGALSCKSMSSSDDQSTNSIVRFCGSGMVTGHRFFELLCVLSSAI